jgi:phosphate-selective porin OprO/OprP
MDTVVADGRHVRVSAQGYWYTGPFGILAEYVRSDQKLVLDGTHIHAVADSWQALAQWVITGDDATYGSVTPRHPFDPSKNQWGAVDVATRVGELRFVDGQVFEGGYADPTKSVRRAWSAGAGADWFANKTFRLVLDLERTWFTLGAKTGDRAPETSIIGRVQTAF